MATFPVDGRSRIDVFLRRNGFQQYRILLLIAAGAVFHGGGEQTIQAISSETEHVDDGEVVVVNETNAVYLKKLKDLKATDFRDYVFSTDRDPFFKAMAEIVRLRGDTIRLDAATNFTAFVKALLTDPKVTSPVRHLFVVSHASEEGFLFTALDVIDTKSISFEDLEKVGTALQIKPEALTPRPKDDQAKDIPPFLHIRGCEIGKAAPYMIKLKAVLGGAVTVTAPLFFHAVEKIASPPGRIEYFLYHFGIFAPDPFQKRADLLAAFDKTGFTDINGAAIPKANWDLWVPRSSFTKPSQTVMSEAVSPVDQKKTKVKGYFRYRLRYFLKDYQILLPPGLRTRDDRQKWLVELVRKWPTMSPDHPFPIYVRFGYATFDDFAQGFKWQIRPDGDQYKLTVTRHEYDVLQPVVEAGTRKLFLNFFSVPGIKNPPPPVILLPDGDPRFFGVY